LDKNATYRIYMSMSKSNAKDEMQSHGAQV